MENLKETKERVAYVLQEMNGSMDDKVRCDEIHAIITYYLDENEETVERKHLASLIKMIENTYLKVSDDRRVYS